MPPGLSAPHPWGGTNLGWGQREKRGEHGGDVREAPQAGAEGSSVTRSRHFPRRGRGRSLSFPCKPRPALAS